MSANEQVRASAIGEAADDGVPVVGGGGRDAAEDGGVVGRGGAELEELGVGGEESEEPGGCEVGVELFDLG